FGEAMKLYELTWGRISAARDHLPGRERHLGHRASPPGLSSRRESQARAFAAEPGRHRAGTGDFLRRFHPPVAGDSRLSRRNLSAPEYDRGDSPARAFTRDLMSVINESTHFLARS